MQNWLKERLVPPADVRRKGAVDVMTAKHFQEFINSEFREHLSLCKRTGRKRAGGISVGTATHWLHELGYEIDKKTGAVYAGT
jgi:hypothetical protein